jgi:hypothetical protein
MSRSVLICSNVRSFVTLVPMTDVFSLRARRRRVLQTMNEQPEHESRLLLAEEHEALSHAIARATEADMWSARATACARSLGRIGGET